MVAEVAALQGNVVDNGRKQTEKMLKKLKKLLKEMLKKLTKRKVLKKNLLKKRNIQMKEKVVQAFKNRS